MDLSNFETEMNRGFLQLLILVMLKKPMYGYMIVKELEEKGYTIEENTLYPLLRRLEKKEILQSKWKIIDGKPRKYYITSKKGQLVTKSLLKIWDKQKNLLNNFLVE